MKKIGKKAASILLLAIFLLVPVFTAAPLQMQAGARSCVIPNEKYWAIGFAACQQAGLDTHGWENNYTKSYWYQYAGHNCTNYVAYRLSLKGVSSFLGGGNANTWANYASNKGYTVDDNPTVGSIAFWSGGDGHVAYVEEVNPTYLVISQDSWGGNFSYAFIDKGHPVTTWPDKFLHIKDEPTSTPDPAPLNLYYDTLNVVDLTQVGATMRGALHNPNRVTVTEVGTYLYQGSTLVKKHGEPMPAENQTLSYVNIWYGVNDELGIQLQPGTTYTYKLYAVANGQEIQSGTLNFTTLPPDPSPEPSPDPSPSPSFSDVGPSHWAYTAVMECCRMGLFSGVDTNRFAPDNQMSRGMLATVLYRLKGSPSVSGVSGFWDVNQSQYYAKPIKWAADNQIVSGMGGGSFAPDSSITREQLAVMLHNYEKKFGSTGNSSTSLSKFIDSSSVGSWAQDSVRWAVSQGILSGKGDGRLDPKGNATRAEVASMLYRFAS